MLHPGESEFVSPNDPMGKSEKYRIQRVALDCEDGLRPIFWVKRGTDGSIYFRFRRSDIVAKNVGLSRFDGNDSSEILESESIKHLPEEARRNPKASLHPRREDRPMPVCIMHTEGHRWIYREPYMDWYPVKSRFTWLHATTGPLSDWPVKTRVEDREATIPFPGGGDSCARIKVAILPVVDGTLPRVHALDSIYGFGPDYGVEVSVYKEDKNPVGIFIVRDNLRQYQGHAPLHGTGPQDA